MTRCSQLLVFVFYFLDLSQVTCSVLAERLTEAGEDIPPLNILPIYSQLPSDLQVGV